MFSKTSQHSKFTQNGNVGKRMGVVVPGGLPLVSLVTGRLRVGRYIGIDEDRRETTGPRDIAGGPVTSPTPTPLRPGGLRVVTVVGRLGHVRRAAPDRLLPSSPFSTEGLRVFGFGRESTTTFFRNRLHFMIRIKCPPL